MIAPDAQSTAAPDARQRRLLEAALTTFTRYGFRKTSMEEVARAAGVSRQGLYLHFPTKEELFRATIEHVLETSLADARDRAQDPALELEDKLVAIVDAWKGRYVGLVGENVTDLHEATMLFGRELFGRYEAQFVDVLHKVLRASKLPAAYKAANLTVRDLADTLLAVAGGLKMSTSTRAEFGDRFRTAVRVVCRPLHRG